MRVRAKIAATATVLLASALALGACGSQGIDRREDEPLPSRRGVVPRPLLGLATRCRWSARRGSASSIKNRVPTNGPNFNIRKENPEQVLYAIENGGFSGAIMPENIVVGDDAKSIASFLSHYSGSQSQTVPSTPITLSTK